MVWIVGLSETPALIHAHNSSHVTKIRHSCLETGFEKEADNRNRFQELSLTKPFKHSFGLADTSMGQKRGQKNYLYIYVTLWQKLQCTFMLIYYY